MFSKIIIDTLSDTLVLKGNITALKKATMNYIENNHYNFVVASEQILEKDGEKFLKKTPTSKELFKGDYKINIINGVMVLSIPYETVEGQYFTSW